MNVNEFKFILKEFPQAFDQVKLLCKKIRGIFFYFLKDGAFFIKIRSNSFEKLYYFIIETFENAIKDNKK